MHLAIHQHAPHTPTHLHILRHNNLVTPALLLLWLLHPLLPLARITWPSLFACVIVPFLTPSSLQIAHNPINIILLLQQERLALFCGQGEQLFLK
jgi:hypothetical protein